MISVFVYQFHVVEQTVAVNPRVGAVAVQRFDTNVVTPIQFSKSFGDHMRRIISQRRFRLYFFK